MAYRKRGAKRPRRSYRKRRGGGWFGMAKKALSVATRVAGLVNAEAKDYYVNQGSFFTNYSGNTVSLNGGITAGSNDGQRTGDSIKMKVLTLRGTLTRAGADCVVRVMIIDDKQNVINQGNLLQYVGSSAVVNSPKQDDLYYDSRILYDQKFVIDTNNPIRMFKIVLPIELHTKYDNSTNAIQNNALKFISYSNINASTPAVEFVSKLTYMDN